MILFEDALAWGAPIILAISLFATVFFVAHKPKVPGQAKARQQVRMARQKVDQATRALNSADAQLELVEQGERPLRVHHG